MGCAVKLGERMKWWNSSYQPIVSQDIQRYKEVQGDIQQEDPKVVIDFIETDFTPLKNTLMDHCQQWQRKLTDLLNENARTEMDNILQHFEANTATFFAPMNDTDDLKARIQLLEQCRK